MRILLLAATCAYVRNDCRWVQGFCAVVRVPAGTFSSKLVDDAGITFVCELCPAGTKQPSGASVECVPCKDGEYQNVKGSISCKRCGVAKYQDQTGAFEFFCYRINPFIQKLILRFI